jgi:hypothetical protein
MRVQLHIWPTGLLAEAWLNHIFSCLEITSNFDDYGNMSLTRPVSHFR